MVDLLYAIGLIAAFAVAVLALRVAHKRHSR